MRGIQEWLSRKKFILNENNTDVVVFRSYGSKDDQPMMMNSGEDKVRTSKFTSFLGVV